MVEVDSVVEEDDSAAVEGSTATEVVDVVSAATEVVEAVSSADVADEVVVAATEDSAVEAEDTPIDELASAVATVVDDSAVDVDVVEVASADVLVSLVAVVEAANDATVEVDKTAEDETSELNGSKRLRSVSDTGIRPPFDSPSASTSCLCFHFLLILRWLSEGRASASVTIARMRRARRTELGPKSEGRRRRSRIRGDTRWGVFTKIVGPRAYGVSVQGSQPCSVGIDCGVSDGRLTNGVTLSSDHRGTAQRLPKTVLQMSREASRSSEDHRRGVVGERKRYW